MESPADVSTIGKKKMPWENMRNGSSETPKQNLLLLMHPKNT
jgi:hypothetical protein